jgi:hypothetical protein
MPIIVMVAEAIADYSAYKASDHTVWGNAQPCQRVTQTLRTNQVPLVIKRTVITSDLSV